MRSFSLKTFLVAIIVLALLLAYGTLQYKYWKLEAEVVRLRLQTGRLFPINKNLVNVVNIPIPQQNLFRWRIYVPPHTRFDGGIQFNDIPAHGVPDVEMFSDLEIESVDGGVLLTAVMTRASVGENEISLRIGDRFVMSNNTDISPDEWLYRPDATIMAGSSRTEVFEYGEPIILIHHKVSNPKANTIPDDKSIGFMIWLIPKRKP